ncbi:2-oxoglutarate and iron-dependent oxygenase domain-containing protein ICU11-like [Solanum verrucosum]|uniref:2-oxoglutarate and iron-dependent oxygenase domain-containing protein ICU11-like n=1 Tax=Solanum verrucosum TaxID=315347 RepID=UPI0020D1C250|nr:2-oxoglutarate and iron-dependent oxygenase domain-containing protein ICU11-like [Solanum verrucosum]
MLVAEVNHFQTWIHKADIRTEHRNNMNNMTYLDDLGMGCMLQNLMDSFISPISKAVQVDDAELTLNVCLGQRFSGGELCFQGVYCEKHVDTPTRPEKSDSTKYYEILGVPNSASQDDLKKAYPKPAIKNNPDKGGDPVKEAFEYSHIVGQAILYQGRNRHVSRVTTAGKRFNLVLGCKSTAFRGMCKLMSDFSWCSKCKQEKERRIRETVSTFMAGVRLK